jgi:uncharacterized Tic20 family protein
MKQPELGLKVAELRQAKSLTQEQLAEACEVSTRTVQRIESGEVDPRSFTLTMLGEVLGFDFSVDQNEHEDFWLTLMHLSSMILALLVPILIWSWKKDKSMAIRKQGRLVLNFQITMILLMAAGGMLILGVLIAEITNPSIFESIGGTTAILYSALTLLPLKIFGVFCFFEGIYNAIRNLMDKPIHYLLSIPFLKES